MDENAVFPSLGSTDSLQKEPVPKTKSGLGQHLGQRSPLKDILNTSPSQSRVMKEPADMLSRFEGVRQLDEEAEWRERTEVVTALDHHHNIGMARDLLEQALVGAINRAHTGKGQAPEAFREVKNFSVVDSESDYESAEEDEVMIQTPQAKAIVVSPCSLTSTTFANSSVLQPGSAVQTPNRSDSFENSLLNSFENMKIDEKDAEKFHDASDDITDHQENTCDGFSAENSPSKENIQPTDLPCKESVQPTSPSAVALGKDHAGLNKDAESFTLPVRQEEHKHDSLSGEEVDTSSSTTKVHMRKVDAVENTLEESETSTQMTSTQGKELSSASPPLKCSPPKAGYIGSLNDLDDINFNPFVTKSKVMNSPDKVDCPQKMVIDKKEVEESVSQASGAKTGASDHQTSPTGSHSDSMKERVDSPTVQCNVSADLTTIPMQTEEDISCSKKHDSYLSSPCKSPNIKCPMKDKRSEQEHQAHKKQKPVNEKTQVHPDEECLPVPSKAYNLEYLEDPNYDPFTTKSCVVNTPEKQGGSSTDIKEKTMSLDSCENLSQQLSEKVSEDIHESVNATAAPEESVLQSALQVEETDDGDEQTLMENTVVACPAEPSPDTSQTDTPSNMHVDFMSLMGDPNFNPFVTKASVANSPDRKILPQSTAQGNGQEVAEISRPKGKESPDEGQHPEPLSKEDRQRKKDAHSGEPLPATSPRDTLKGGSSTSPSKKKGSRKSFSSEEEFTNASDFFSNPEVLDALETHGVQGDKCNLVRNSLYVKFDPLVSGRQSLAPYLAQQLLRKDQQDVRRSSGLISFSPSPKKKQNWDHQSDHKVPVESFFSTMDSTITLDTTATATLDSTALEATNETVIHNPAAAAAVGKMVPEAEMNNRIKNVELMMQDEILRKSRIFEEEKKELLKKIEEQKKELSKQIEEQNIALLANEEENSDLKKTIQQMTSLVSKMKAAYDTADKQHQENLELQKEALEAKLSSASEEQRQTQEELSKTEASFFQLVRKFERLREVSELLQKQKEKLVEEIEKVEEEKKQSTEKYKTALKTLQESYEKAQEEHQLAKQNHEQEMKRASALIKHAELKILSLTETEAKKNTEIKRLTSLLEDITGNMGGQG